MNDVLRATGRAAKSLAQGVGAAGARARAMTPRPPRFTGAYDSRDAALAAIPASLRGGYDDESIADVSFPQMCERAAFDYPLIFWLSRLLPDLRHVVDAGGHLGTKYIAFSGVMDLSGLQWTVQDLPGIVAAARKRQAAGGLPAELRFAETLKGLECPDLLLASGLMQYLDRPLAALLEDLGGRPRHILLNKVALRDGPAVFTIERIGHGRVPYQIRSRAAWQAELEALGYDLRDSWEIGELSHAIPTHPWLGRSASRGYLLERRD
jgi:putative methyltransferase (TIGR04325 family)